MHGSSSLENPRNSQQSNDGFSDRRSAEKGNGKTYIRMTTRLEEMFIFPESLVVNVGCKNQAKLVKLKLLQPWGGPRSIIHINPIQPTNHPNCKQVQLEILLLTTVTMALACSKPIIVSILRVMWATFYCQVVCLTKQVHLQHMNMSKRRGTLGHPTTTLWKYMEMERSKL